MFENEELIKFYTDIQEEIKFSLLTEEEGANPEQIFTDVALTMLSDAGETENYRICYDEKLSKRGVEHKLNAYALSENYETLDLFITIYNVDVLLARPLPHLCQRHGSSDLKSAQTDASAPAAAAQAAMRASPNSQKATATTRRAALASAMSRGPRAQRPRVSRPSRGAVTGESGPKQREQRASSP